MVGKIVEIRDFTVSDTMIQFTVGQDRFEALPDLPLTIMQDMAKLSNIREATAERGIDAILDVTDIFLTDESAALFRKRVLEKKIGLRAFMNIINWLLEEYGVRPTQPSSSSSAGLNDDETGISSTDGVQPGESIL